MKWLDYYHRSSGGIASTIAHSTIWHAVSRLLRHLPVLVVLGLALVAGVYLLMRRSSARRPDRRRFRR